MSIKFRLTLLIATMIAAMIILITTQGIALKELKIGSPIYNQIISDKDLLADILPPPEYVIESFLTVYQLLDDENLNDQTKLWSTLERLKTEYETRKLYWQEQNLPSELQQPLQQAQKSADDFYRLIDQLKLTPANKQLVSDIKTTYYQHRLAIDKLVENSNKHFNQVSSDADKNANYYTNLVILIATVIFIALLWQGIMTHKKINQPIAQLQLLVTQVSAGDFSAQSSVRGKDEMAELGLQINGLIQNLKVVINDVINVSTAIANGELGHHMKDNLPGDLGKLAAALNRSFAQADESISMVSNILEAVQEGKLLNEWSGHSKFSHLKGIWHRAVSNGEQALMNRERILKDIFSVMNQAQQGNFTARCTTPANGLFQDLMNALNTTLDRLEMVIGDINRAVTQQANGDLDILISCRAEGQLETLKDNINLMTNRTKQVVMQISLSAHIVESVSDQVLSSTNDLSQRIQSQAAALEETSATITEMTQAVQSNAHNAKSATQMVSTVQTKAQTGHQVMIETIEAMSAIRESSHQIADIVSLIDSIAFQTNLLALNAAVEAARAGEHGRGFAVVAGEVRALAQKSASAAQDIRHLIDDSVARVAFGTDLAHQSGAMLHDMLTDIEQVNDAISHISHASVEQANGISQVNLAVADLDKTTQENAALVETTNASAINMAQESRKLEHQVEFFKFAPNY
jgi:methyl-accepting chemotaxis protein